MTTTIVRYQVRPERGDDNARLRRRQRLTARRPDGMRYTVCSLADETFVCIVETDDGARRHRSTSLAEFERPPASPPRHTLTQPARIAGYQPRRSRRMHGDDLAIIGLLSLPRPLAARPGLPAWSVHNATANTVMRGAVVRSRLGQHPARPGRRDAARPGGQRRRRPTTGSCPVRPERSTVGGDD